MNNTNEQKDILTNILPAVLLLYLRNYLGWGDDTATSVYHAFSIFAYFFPLVGGIIADSYLGRYWTIVILSVVYVIGHALKTIGAIPYIPGHTTHAYVFHVIICLFELNF